jgi:hypothetical protein
MTRYKVFQGSTVFDESEHIFFNEHFCGEIVKFYQFFREVLLQIHLGPGTARIWNDFFRIRIRILLKVSDPIGSGSGSTTLVQAHNIKLPSGWQPLPYSIFIFSDKKEVLSLAV